MEHFNITYGAIMEQLWSNYTLFDAFQYYFGFGFVVSSFTEKE